MIIVICYRINHYLDLPIESYARSFHRELANLGHEVYPVGEGHTYTHFSEHPKIQIADLFIDLDTGRNSKGDLHFQNFEGDVKIPSVFYGIDNHGHPSYHRRASKYYNHVFFAVFAKRDLFSKHPSAHWCPNATDSTWFDIANITSLPNSKPSDIGFFGSKSGLDRADILKPICNRRSLSYDIREVGRGDKHRWPRTAEAMANCKILFNRGQKHDGPNQRVFESMMMNRPLINNRDKTDGMETLFKEGEHYLGYETEAELGIQIDWLLSRENFECMSSIVENAYKEVKEKHQIKNRVRQIMEVCL